MKTSIICFLLLSFFIGAAQSPKMKYIQVTGTNVHDRELTIMFPVFTFKNSTISKRINRQLAADFRRELTDDTIITFDSVIKEAIESFLSAFDYEVHNHKNLYGFTFYFEGTGAYVTMWRKHYFFEKSTGTLLTLDSLIRPDRHSDFMQQVTAKQSILIKEWFEEVQMMVDSSWADKEDLEYIKEEAKNNCMPNYDPRQFLINGDSLEIIIECPLPKVMQNLTFVEHVIFKKEELTAFLKPKYRYLFK